MYAPILKTLAVVSLLTTSANAAQEVTEATAGCDADPDICEVIVADFLVTVQRLPVQASGQAVTKLDVAEHRRLRLDTLLASTPGVGLFRRANSLTAHPTTQGLNMRGVGANAAGRVLVTLDGVPLNDPFGGWVYWAGLDQSTLGQVTVFRGGSGGAFGAQSLVGAVELASGSMRGKAASLSAHYGSDNSYDLSGHAEFGWQGGFARVTAGQFETDGDYLLAAADRGVVDVRAASDVSRISLLSEQNIGGVVARANVRYFSENRVNGLALAVNATEALDVSLALEGRGAGLDWELITYFRDRQFANVFASARDDRTTERAVLDQFDVPAWGAGLLARVQFDGVELGMDGRRMSGETNERFRNLGAGFTRQRRAGGDQWTLGFYGEYSHEADWGDFSVTVRHDRWRTYNGVRDEFNIEDGFPGFASPDRSDVVPDRKGGVWTGRVGADLPLTGAVDMRMAAYKSWRLPTLNEYYRPFRVVNDITEANPELKPETLYGVEVGFDYEPLNTVKLSATYFRNWLRNGIGNVTIGFGPAFFPLGGFVPDGGVLRQRANVDESITDGIELDARLELQPGWTLSASYLYARARVTEFEAMPELVGKRPVQTPAHSFTLSAAFEAQKWSLNTEGRFAAHQYDDDLNMRRLGAIFTVNAGVRYQVSPAVSLKAQMENLFDAKVVSAVTADGLETLAQRRFVRVGLAVGF